MSKIKVKPAVRLGLNLAKTFLEEDIQTLIDSNTYPVGDLDTLQPALVTELNDLKSAVGAINAILEG